MIQPTHQQEGNDVDTTEQTHSSLRGDDDALPGDAEPTMEDPGTMKEPADPAAVALDRFAALTPGDVVHAEVVDQSGQAPPEAAQEWTEGKP